MANPFKRKSGKRAPAPQQVLESARAFAVEYMRNNPRTTPAQLQEIVAKKFNLKVEK